MLKFYTTTEVAEMLGTTDRSVRRKISNKKINACTIVKNKNKVYGIEEKEISKLVRNNK